MTLMSSPAHRSDTLGWGERAWRAWRGISLAQWMLLAAVGGIVFGLAAPGLAPHLKFISDIFLRLIRAIIAPVLFGVLVRAVGGVSGMKDLGRLGWKALLYFEVATTLALLLGWFAAVIVRPGAMDACIEGAPEDTSQYQAEFRHPDRYFNADGLVYASDAGAALMRKHAAVLAEIEARTGVPAQIIVSIWGRESSFGAANIPHDAFRILGTKGFMSTRAPFFTDELIAALQIVAQGFASRDAMRSSWAGALGQPQFMPSSYLKYAVDGDADGRVDIWHSEADTLASIGAYLAAHGWKAGRDGSRRSSRLSLPLAQPARRALMNLAARSRAASKAVVERVLSSWMPRWTLALSRS